MENNVLKLTGILDQKKSLQQINADIKRLERVISALRVTASFAREESQKELDVFLEQTQTQIDHAKLKLSIDTKQTNAEVNQLLSNVSFRDIDSLDIDQSKLALKVKKVIAHIRTSFDRNPVPLNLTSRTDKLGKDLDSYISKNSKISTSPSLQNEAEQVRALINSVTDSQSFDQANDSLRLFRASVRAAGFETASTADKIHGMVSHIKTIGGLFGLASTAAEAFSKSLDTLKANDSILSQLSASSRLTRPQLAEIDDKSFQVAGRYGQSTGDYLREVQEMARAGYQDPGGMAQLSLALRSAGDMTAELANQYIAAADNAFQMRGSVYALTSALDGAANIASRHALSMSDLAEAMSLAGSQSHSLGLGVDETTAALSAMISVTHQSGSQAASAFHTLLMNLRQVTGEAADGTTVDTEGLEKYRKACADLGVSLYTLKDGAASLKEPMDILGELSKAYAGLTSSDSGRSDLLDSVGSETAAAALDAILQNYGLYEEMMRNYSDGMGSLDREAARAASSWEGRLNSLQNSWDSFVNTLTNKELIRGGVSFFDRLIQGAEAVADTIGELPVLLAAATSSMVMKNKDYGITALKNPETGKLNIQGNLFGIDFTAMKNMKNHLSEAKNAIEEWNGELNNACADINLFENDVVRNNATLKDYLSTCSKEAPASLEGYKAYLNKAGISTDALRLKTLLLSSVISAGIGLALQAAVTVIGNYIHRIERADDALSSSVSSYETAKSELASINSELENQSKRMDELLSKDSLTYADQDELDNLQKITRELELQKALKEEEIQRDARESAQKAAEAYQTRRGNPASDIFIDANYDTLKGTQLGASVLGNTNNINQQIAAYRILQEEQEKALLSQSEDYDDIAQKTQTIKDNLYQQLEVTEEYRKQLMALPYDELTAGQKRALDQLNNDRRFLWKELEPGKWNDYQFESVLDQNDLGTTRQQLIELAKAGKIDEGFILSNPNLLDALNQLDLFLEDGVTNTQAFIRYITALGELTPDLPDPPAAEPPDFPSGSITKTVDLLDGMADKWKAVNSLYDEFLNKGTGNFSNGAMADLVHTFKDLDGVSLDRFLSTLSDSTSTTEDVRLAFNRLAAEFLISSGCLDNLTDATAEQTARELEAQGITNASAVVYDYLAASKEFCAFTGKDLAAATQGEVLAFLNEAGASDLAKKYIAQLELSKLAVNGVKINTASDIEQIVALANAADVADDIIIRLTRVQELYSSLESGDGSDVVDGNILELLEEAESLIEQLENGTFDFKLKSSYFTTPIFNGITPPPVSNTPSLQAEREKEATIETIDWIQRKNDALKDQHDLLSRLAEDETASYGQRMDALSDLIDMDKERADTAGQAAQAYRDAWQEAVKDLQDQDIARIMVGLSDEAVANLLEGLPEQDITEILDLLHNPEISRLMNEDLNIAEYNSDEYGEDYADNLKKAMDLWDQIGDKLKEADEIQRDSNDHIREQIKLQGQLIDAQQELLSLELERAQAKLDMAETSGKAVTESMYRGMISSSDDIIDSYRDKIDNLEDQLSQFDEDSAEYQSIEAQITQCENSIADCRRQQEEWNDAIKRIPIDRISKYLSMLQNIKQDLQNFLDQQSAMGLEPSPQQLQQIIDLSQEEITKLLEQQEKLRKLLTEYDYGSEKFQQTSQEIQDIDNQISSLIQSQMEYNESILRSPIDQLSRQRELLSNARSDLENSIAQQEAGGIGKTLEQYQALSALSRKQLENLSAQKEMLTALLGVYDKDSSKYQDTLNEIQGIQDSISSLVQEQTKWNDEILQIPLDRLQDYAASLSNARSDLENGIAQQEADGIGKTLEQYQALHSVSMKQLEALGQHKSVLQAVMDVYDEDSDQYKEAQSQLQGMEDSISSLIQEQTAWNNEILRIPIDKMEDYSDSLSGARTDLENSIAEQEARGVGKTMEQYQALQSMSMRQIENLTRQKEMLTSLLDVYDKDSSQYAETQDKIRSIEGSISSLVQEQARWNQEILRIPIDKISSQSDALSNVRSNLENQLSLQESQGVGKTLGQYQTLHSVSMEQIRTLSQQKQMLTALLDVYDKDSDLYQQTQNEIQGIDGSIASLIQEQTRWNQEILQIPIEKMKEYSGSLDSLKSDLQGFLDLQSARGIDTTAEQYQQLNAVTLAQLEALKSRKEMLTQLMGQYDQDSDVYKTASQDIRDVDSAIQSLVKEQYEWNQAILQMPVDRIAGINEELNRYSSALGDVLSDYDTALSAVNSVLDEQIDKINESREASEKAYEDKIKPIQDELDLLRKQNEERSVQLALEQAAYDLDRAKNQKTTQVIRDGQVQYEADADALRQANESKAQAEYNKIVYDLEKQIEGLTQERDGLLEGYDAQIEQLEKIREKWSSIAEEIKLASDITKASEIFGTSGWKDKILSGNDSDLYEPFQKMYQSIYDQKEQTDRQIASNERISQMMELLAEQYRSGAVTYEQAMSRISQLTDAMSGGYSALEQLGSLMSSDGIKDLSQITGSSAEKIASAVDSLAGYLETVKANNESVQDYTASWLETQAGIADRLADLQTPPVSQDMFREYLDAVKSNQQDMDRYIQSWESVKDSVDGQMETLRAAAETMDQFRKYLEMVRQNEDELSSYVQSWGDVKNSVDRQVEALDDASLSLEEFQKYLEAVKSNRDDLTGYTQTWNAIQTDVEKQISLLESVSGSLGDIQEFINAVNGNQKGLQEYVQAWKTVKESVDSQVSSLGSTEEAMERFRENLEAYQKNAENISQYTATWEQMKGSIAEQVEALKRAADSLENMKKNISKWILQRYPGGIEQGGLIRIPIGGDIEDDGRGWGKSQADDVAESIAAAAGDAFGSTFSDFVEEALDFGPGAQTNALKASSSIPVPENTETIPGVINTNSDGTICGYELARCRPLKPGDFPLLDRLMEAAANGAPPIAPFSDMAPIYESVSGQDTLASIIRMAPRPVQTQNNMEVSIGDIVVQGTKDPDAFAKALYQRLEPAMNQNFSKIFR